MKSKILVLDAGGPGSTGVLKGIRDLQLTCTTIACDKDEYAAGRLFADLFIQVPPGSSKGYGAAIASIIEEHEIDLVMPSFHYGFGELQTLHHAAFLTDFKTGLICQDKLRFYEWCHDAGLPVPYTQALDETFSVQSPSYIKPRFGVGSKNNHIVIDNEEFTRAKDFIARKEPYVVQDLVKGGHWQTESLILDGKMISCVTFQTLRVISGNSSVVLIKHNASLISFATHVAMVLNLSGAFNLEVFSTGEDFVIIEINPRFGSGRSFIAHAGHDVAAYLITGDWKYLSPPKEGVFVRHGDISFLRT